MRLIMIAAPEGKGDDVSKIAFSVGIDTVSRRQITSLNGDGRTERKDVVDIETATPLGKRFVDAILAAPFYNRDDFTISIRQPRAIISKTRLNELTEPFVEPASDILQELWQFSHITASFVGRVFVGGCLIAYGMIGQKMLLIIAGLLILPLSPLLFAVSFGLGARIWNLAGKGALAFSVVTILLFTGGLSVAAISQPPIKYDDFNTLLTSLLISVGIGIAGGFANIDDAGQRQLIGLAAAAQIALIPVWLGICAIFGFPATVGQSEIISRIASFFLNIVALIVVTFIIYTASRAASGSLKKMQAK